MQAHRFLSDLYRAIQCTVDSCEIGIVEEELLIQLIQKELIQQVAENRAHLIWSAPFQNQV